MANQLFQYSTMSALMDGVADTGLPLRELLGHGDLGLGTFRHMVGEMIVLGGRVYHMKSDGTVSAVHDLSIVTPFAMVTHFTPSLTLDAVVLASKQDLEAMLHRLIPSATNHFVVLRIEGRIKSVTVRTTPGQQYPGQRLAEMAHAEQVEHTFVDELGTFVGFRCPQYIHGIGVAGIHLHYIARTGQHGGHVLVLETDEVELALDVMSAFHLQLPADSADFDAAPLRPDNAAITKVEG